MYLFGASGHAKVIIDILHYRDIPIRGLYDDDTTKKELMGYPVRGDTADYTPDGTKCLITIGDNRIRRRVTERIEADYGLAIHPEVIISGNVRIGDGTAIMAGVTINTDTVIGRHNIINTSATVDHDCFFEDFVHIAPNATLCGGIRVGEGTLIGAGSVVIPNINVGRWSIIAAGAVVIEDVPDGVLVAGNPARIVKTLNADIDL